MPSGFCGIDPPGLLALAVAVDRSGRLLAETRRSAVLVLEGHSILEAARVDSILAAAEHGLYGRICGLRWRAALIAEGQRDALGVGDLVAQRVLTVDADIGPGDADFEQWRLAVIVSALQEASPRDRAAAFAAMAETDVAGIVELYPEQLGAMDGAPPQLRYEANEILIRREIERLEDILRHPGSHAGFDNAAAIKQVVGRLADYRCWLSEGRQILLFEPSGDGRVVEVFGDLEGAERIAVVVPGITNSIENFSAGHGGFRSNAAALYEATSSGGIATIAWLGYDTPDNVGATLTSAADDGAPALQLFLEGVDPGGTRVVTVIAHSYGSVLAGTAARTGLEADDLVFVGSPGTTLDHAGDAVLRSGGHVWAALAVNDPIAFGVDPGEIPWWLPPPLWPFWIGGDLWNDGAEDLWHGANPVGDDFGARHISTDGSTGHSEYFEAGSLENLARIVGGLYDEVELVD